MKPKGILTLHREINDGKYNKFTPSAIAPDISEEYYMLPTGWRSKKGKRGVVKLKST